MRRLLWKEHHESWLYGITLSISSILVVAIGTAYTYQGHNNQMTGWFFLPAIISIVFGAYSSSHEKESNTQDYVSCLPIYSDRQVLAKAAVVLIYNTIAALIGLIAFMAICLPEYRPFLSYDELGYGVLKAIGITSLAWYFGFGLSIFHRFETNLHMLFWAVMMAVVLPFSAVHTLHESWWGLWSTWILLTSPFLVYMLHRHEKWRSDSNRLKFGFVAISILAITSAQSMGRYQEYLWNRPITEKALISLSPYGDIALFKLTVRTRREGLSQVYWQFATPHNGNLPLETQKAYTGMVSYNDTATWADRNTVIVYTTLRNVPYISIISFKNKHRPISRLVPRGGYYYQTIPSDNGDYVIYANFDYKSLAPIRILDVRHAKWLTEPIKVRNCWWQSDRSMGYIDAAGKRRILPLPGP
ncbi:MAG: ABC transporter permease [Armatimonadota bacterium]